MHSIWGYFYLAHPVLQSHQHSSNKTSVFFCSFCTYYLSNIILFFCCTVLKQSAVDCFSGCYIPFFTQLVSILSNVVPFTIEWRKMALLCRRAVKHKQTNVVPSEDCHPKLCKCKVRKSMNVNMVTLSIHLLNLFYKCFTNNSIVCI